MDRVEAVLRYVNEIPSDVYAASGMVRIGPERRVACKGRSPGLRNGALRRACAELFVHQLRAQRPCALVVFGTYLPSALVADFPAVFPSWKGTSFALRDADDAAVVRGATMDDVTVPIVVSILHPSLRGPNLMHRRFDGCGGAEAERALWALVRGVVRERWMPAAT